MGRKLQRVVAEAGLVELCWAPLKEKWCGFGIQDFWIKCSMLGELIVISLNIVLNADYRFAGEGYWCWHSTLLLRLCVSTMSFLLCALCLYYCVKMVDSAVLCMVYQPGEGNDC